MNRNESASEKERKWNQEAVHNKRCSLVREMRAETTGQARFETSKRVSN